MILVHRTKELLLQYYQTLPLSTLCFISSANSRTLTIKRSNPTFVYAMFYIVSEFTNFDNQATFEIDPVLQNSLVLNPRKQINTLLSEPIHPTNMPIQSLTLDIWYEILVLLDIKEAIALSFPRFFGAYIESEQAIRFRNAINSYMRSGVVDLPVGPLASFVCSVMLFTILKPPFLVHSKISTCPFVEHRCESQVV
jgi:hypothetical protein